MSENEGAKPTAPLLAVAVGGRCPRCGQGSLFKGYLTVAEQCSVCGLKLAGHDTGDGPAFFIMMPLCIVAAGLALLTELAFAPPIWVHIVTWPILIILVVAVSLRPVKATMIALQYRYRNVEDDAGSNQQ